MKAFDRLFIGIAGIVLLSAAVVRTVAQTESAPELSGETRTNARPVAREIVLPDAAPDTKTPAVAASDDVAADTTDTTPADASDATSADVSAPDTKTDSAPVPAKTATIPAKAATKGGATATANAKPASKAKSVATPRAVSSKPGVKANSAKPLASATTLTGAPLFQRDGDVIIRAAAGGIYDEARDVARITKDVRVTQEGEDFVLLCQQIVYDRGRNGAVATGNPKISTRDTSISGARLQADFNRKVVVMTGNVELRSRGKGDGLKSNSSPVSRSKPSRLTCDRVEYNYETRDAIITGSIHMMQDTTSGTCDKVLFDEENNIVTMQGRAKFVNTQGQTIESPELKVWLDSGVAQSLRDTNIRIKPRTNGTPIPRAPKGAVEAVPQLPEELLRDFDAVPNTATPKAATPSVPTVTPTLAPAATS